MNYRREQAKSKLEDWYICNKLHLRLDEWKEVKNGKRHLAGNRLDTFKKLTDPAEKEYINQEEERNKIIEWKGTLTQETLDSFKVNQSDVAKHIGVNSSTVCNIINGKYVPFSPLALMYYFFIDENNRRYKPRKYKRKKKIEEPIAPKVEENDAIENKDEAIENEEVFNGEEDWFNLFRQVSIKYNEAQRELERYRYLIDKLIERD